MTLRSPVPNRREVAAGLLVGLAPSRLIAGPSDQSIRFSVFRNGSHIGEHEMSFTRAGDFFTAVTSVAMVVHLGPVPVFRYSHQANETWRDDRFERLDTSTVSNGKPEKVTARAQSEAVTIETLTGSLHLPATAAPLTHWNQRAFGAPLFNPQTGKPLKVSTRKVTGERLRDGVTATRWMIRGESEIDDWYDEAGVWSALRGRLPDRSIMEYRRL